MTDSPQQEQEEILQNQQELPQETPAQGKLQQTFKCANCAARMEFKPGSESQRCPYCSHENPIPKSEEDIRELDFRAYLAELSDEDMLERLTVKCSECAAETTAAANVTSHECPFCGSNIVATASSSKQLKPRSLLPFAVTRAQGWESFRVWISRLWFAPNDLKRMAGEQEKLSGMYVPYWTYDADTISFYRGQRGEHYWVTEHYTTRVNGKTQHRTRRVRKTRWYPVSGTVWGSFDDVLVLASQSLPRKYTEKLEPWDLPNLVPYKDDYLSGFRAESYQIDLPTGFSYARTIMDEGIRLLICRDIGGDEQQITSVNTQYDNVTFKHILLPIWISAYRYKERVYRFLINARTGEVQGERPWSWVKIVLLVMAVLLLIITFFAVFAFNGSIAVSSL
jgi:DNA-directed RNA polymerase subunit RPC12/RpoP